MRLKGAFVTRFIEELRFANLIPHIDDACDLGTSPEDHKHVEKFMENMKYELTEVLLAPAMQEMNGKYRSGRVDAQEKIIKESA